MDADCNSQHGPDGIAVLLRGEVGKVKRARVSARTLGFAESRSELLEGQLESGGVPFKR